MAIVSGITPIGTVWIKNFDEKGRLISKRVVKNGVQFDVGFRRSDQAPSFFLKTDLQTGKQFFKPIPFKNGSDGIYHFSNSQIRVKELQGMNYYLGFDYENSVREITGFLNKEIDKVTEKLLKSLIKR